MKFPLEVDMCERNELLKNMHPSSVKLVVCMNGLARCALGGWVLQCGECILGTRGLLLRIEILHHLNE